MEVEIILLLLPHKFTIRKIIFLIVEIQASKVYLNVFLIFFIGHPKPGIGSINDDAGSPLKTKGLIPSEGTMNLLPQGNNTGNS